MTPPTYPTDLDDAEWSLLQPLLPAPADTGRPREHDPRQIVSGILYMVRGGCAWRLLPHEFPPWKTVYHYFRLWRVNGLWQRIHTTLREAERQRVGRKPQPTAGILVHKRYFQVSKCSLKGLKSAPTVL